MALAGGLAPRWRAGAQTPEELKLEQIKSDLYMLTGSGGNMAVLTTDEGVILVDDKFDRNVTEILAKVRKLTDKPVRYVLTTHHHGDHTGGNPRLLGSVEIIAHENARANMVKGSQPGLPRVAFSDGAAVYLGGKEVRTRYYGRGHTNGDVAVYYPAHRLVHLGDLLVEGTPFIDYANGGSGVAWTATLEQTLPLDFDTVIPGHGPLMKRQDLVNWIASFKTVRERIAQMLREKRPKAEILTSLKVDDLAGWKPNQFWTQRSLPGLVDELSR
jgi:glyoxylase-like metal-dependent hydrolase (beta-lactamase superfamily II)